MRIDVVTIFPAWFDSLDVSLTGKARASGLLDIAVHDLRDWTHDRHRTVDDTPYGGGAGMVMKPEPWGEALDAVRGDATARRWSSRRRAACRSPRPSPASSPGATTWSFACGRYEGIDQRVIDEAATAYDVRELSLGDFVLNGGEVAAAAFIEAVVRLLPGFMGNPESLAEESHEDGLLEYPVYTKPASWRGRDVPAVLLSGDHARSRPGVMPSRYAARSPAAPTSPTPRRGRAGRPRPRRPPRDPGRRRRAVHADPGLLAPGALGQPRRRRSPRSEESFEDVLRGLEDWTTFVALRRRPDRRLDPRQGSRRRHGLGRRPGDGRARPPGAGAGPLPPRADRGRRARRGDVVRAVDRRRSVDNIRMYKKAGYRLRGPAPGPAGAVMMTKRAGDPRGLRRRRGRARRVRATEAHRMGRVVIELLTGGRVRRTRTVPAWRQSFLGSISAPLRLADLTLGPSGQTGSPRRFGSGSAPSPATGGARRRRPHGRTAQLHTTFPHHG